MFRTRKLGALLLIGWLAVTPLFLGCDSATGPKFPDPIEEEEDSTEEEGMQRRWSLAPADVGAATLSIGVMPFTHAVRETT